MYILYIYTYNSNNKKFFLHIYEIKNLSDHERNKLKNGLTTKYIHTYNSIIHPEYGRFLVIVYSSLL